ncbi:MAG TPA: (d)CMP kinase [Longimicrobiales bacterium]|nr:(d)CMP kinase [Longimicrobiales bacterium]
MIIAIDGPAGSGKSSTARAVARELGFRHLDSGAFYRALTYAAMERGIPPAEWPKFDEARLESFHVSAEPADTGFRMLLAGNDISGPIRRAEVNALVSAMARVPAVRDWLLRTLRETARHTDLVADGRDMGTVVFPAADLKIFLVADPAVRAQRRLTQMGLPVDEESVRDEVDRIEARDRADSSREVAPLRQATDAVLLDTTDLTFDAQVARIVELARARSHDSGPATP